MAILFEMTEEYKYFLEDKYDIAFEKGLYTDIRYIKRTSVKEYKVVKKEIRATMKQRDWVEAKKSIKKAKLMLDKIKSESNKVSEPEFADYVKWFFGYMLKNMVLSIVSDNRYIYLDFSGPRGAKYEFQRWIDYEYSYLDKFFLRKINKSIEKEKIK